MCGGNSWRKGAVFLKKKHRWCAWDTNPGPQDGRRRRNHGAMAVWFAFFTIKKFTST